MPSKVLEPSGFYIQQRPWTPTKRRGPIAAEFNTPGPAAFTLPSTFGPNCNDARKAKPPAYSFGIKYDEKHDIATPGPGEYTVDGVTKSGKDWSRSAFISPRFKEPEPFKTPAPGAYNPEKSFIVVKEQSPSYTFGVKVEENERDLTPSPCDYKTDKSINSVRDQAPSYTFGFKIKEPKEDLTPAPSEYNIERGVNQISTHLQTPSFTIGIRLNDSSTENIPGPGSYDVPEVESYKIKKSPAYTLGSKTSLPEDKTVKPGPNDYKTEKVWINKTSTPRFTFGIKHSEYSLSG
ncbi:outer dense fiber protein 3-like protein [Dinothrombium tinctorium]|uniref:Outer dense fiber protein 3-like protein n=1 Tax=Dinothrombium tinctorium TaxID=1965070 RepID=A0A3S3SN55_9ACAR|nr:outer dense fiber protein 3-like protein [Dinothrombium tinctorium]